MPRNGSFATGVGNSASGATSFVAGTSNNASGNFSFVLGQWSQAGGDNSGAFGQSASVYGTSSFAMGYQARIFPGAHHSIALGGNAKVTKLGGIAAGFECEANEAGAGAFGYGSHANGISAMAFGRGLRAGGYFQTAVGMFNATTTVPADAPGGVADFHAGTDIVFLVGNGTNESVRSNALTVRKDSGTAIGTGVTSNAAGQIVVGRYNNTSPDNSPSGTYPRTTGAFIVGAGSAVTPNNALRILDDGTVLVKESGDIVMHNDFRNGPKP